MGLFFILYAPVFCFPKQVKALLPGLCPYCIDEFPRQGKQIGALVKGSSTADTPQMTQPGSGKHCCANCHHQGLIMKMREGVCRVWEAVGCGEGMVMHQMPYQGLAGWLTLAGLTVRSSPFSTLLSPLTQPDAYTHT